MNASDLDPVPRYERSEYTNVMEGIYATYLPLPTT